ncbi:G patch domain-containing protein 4 [Calliphora vicina]|uniref:G patch domain-containing protein 4 n=1 Tax=Calliphora vicina TaxID=7373 RepID=UPI00325A6B73
MDFARKILLNCGWKDGDGLGKKRDGIAKPLRATLKFDNAGFGADQAASDFNNHWWERVFNEAATNVNVNHEGEQIKMGLKDDEDAVEISTKSYSIKKLKKLKNRGESSEMRNGYENFLQAATLTNLGDEIENPDKIDTNDIEVTKVKVLTDEELFKACGGRTAHKGARHGLNLSGKLARIEQQEAELLAKMMAKRNQEQFTEQKLKKKKNKIKDKIQAVVELDLVENDKLKKKKRKHCEVECTVEDVPSNQKTTVEKCKKKKKKHLSEIESDAIDQNLETVNMEVIPLETNDELKPLKNKKNKNKDKILEVEIDEIVHKKKKKKNKHKDIEH